MLSNSSVEIALLLHFFFRSKSWVRQSVAAQKMCVCVFVPVIDLMLVTGETAAASALIKMS